MRRLAFGIICLLVTTPGKSQSVQSKGNGNANTGVNNGQVIVNNFRMSARLEQTLKDLASGAGKWEGVLYPGTQPTDFGKCTGLADSSANLAPKLSAGSLSIKDSYVVRLGSSTVICHALPCEILGINGKNVLSLVRLNNSVGVKAQFRAADRDMVAVIDGSEWHANDREAWYVKRPDEHTIIVMDRKNEEILWVSLKNRRYVAVRGTFRDSKGVASITVTDSDIVTPVDSTVANSCFNKVGDLPQEWKERLRIAGMISINTQPRLRTGVDENFGYPPTAPPHP